MKYPAPRITVVRPPYYHILPVFLPFAITIFASCSPKPLDPAGNVLVWSGRSDTALVDVASSLEGHSIATAPANEPWLKLLQKIEGSPDLVAIELNRDAEAAAAEGLLLDLEPFRARMSSTARLRPSMSGRDGATYDRYVLPSSVYIWGLFYNKAILGSFGLEPPGDWEDFERLLAEVKLRGTIPLALGSSFGWPALAWVSVLDIRFNGLEAHRKLIDGERTFSDPSLARIFETLARWRDAGLFDRESGAKNWPEAIADVDTGKAAFTLMGAFAVNRFGRPREIEFMLVPLAEQRSDIGELAVVQAFAVAASSSSPEAAAALADTYVAAGSPGQVGDAFRLPAVAVASDAAAGAAPSGSSESIKILQADGLKRAKGLVPQLDRILPTQAAYDANQAAVRFFAPDSEMSAEAFAAALDAARGTGR